MPRNPYQAPSKKELQKQAEERKDIEKKINIAIDVGKRILSSTDGMRYREILKHIKSDLNKNVMEHPGFADPAQDAHFLRGCIIKMGVLETLLGDIERDAGRKPYGQK